jgi:hypothetical protein
VIFAPSGFTSAGSAGVQYILDTALLSLEMTARCVALDENQLRDKREKFFRQYKTKKKKNKMEKKYMLFTRYIERTIRRSSDFAVPSAIATSR